MGDGLWRRRAVIKPTSGCSAAFVMPGYRLRTCGIVRRRELHMTFGHPHHLRAALFAACATTVMALAGAAQAEAAAAAADAGASANTVDEVLVTVAKTTRSSVELGGTEVQKILPGVSPLKAV